ncbi:MAG TPA: MarP family serine protease [Solirubrobacterales bacterium]|nr:MarP family serine protease [Solirubrobacterales bacterium]
MTAIDWGIVFFTFFLALWGFRQGLIVGALGLGGLAIGAVLGSRLAPVILEGGSNSAYAPMIALLGAILIGSITLALAVTVGEKIRSAAIRGPFWQVIDGIGGALLIAAVALGVVWVLGAVVLYTPGAESLRKDAQKSILLGGINRLMPPSGPLIQALHRIDPVPKIARSPGAIEVPDAGAGSSTAVRSASASVVKVAGTACGVGVMGSGWVVAPGTIVTNAHVVAGQDDTRVETFDGQVVDATPVAYNPKNDIAVLQAGIDKQALPMMASATPETSAAVIGYPNDGPLSISPARAGETQQVLGEDAYGSGPVERPMLTLRGLVQHGNSGGPLVDQAGRVLGTIFAATTEGPQGGLAVPNKVVKRIVDGASGEVDTGPCAR